MAAAGLSDLPTTYSGRFSGVPSRRWRSLWLTSGAVNLNSGSSWVLCPPPQCLHVGRQLEDPRPPPSSPQRTAPLRTTAPSTADEDLGGHGGGTGGALGGVGAEPQGVTPDEAADAAGTDLAAADGELQPSAVVFFPRLAELPLRRCGFSLAHLRHPGLKPYEPSNQPA